MALEDYQLSTLRDDVLEEFGKDITDTALKAKATRKINDAQSWIAKARTDWPWRLNEIVFLTVPGISVVADVVTGVFGFANVTPNSPSHLRRVAVSGTASPGTEGYLIANVSGGDYIIQGQWLGSTALAQPLTIMQAVFPTTIDFERMQVLEAVTSQGERRYTYKSPLMFEKIKRSANLIGSNDFIYTVKPDPINVDDTVKYVFVYPYINERMNLHGNYWKSVPELVDDTDIPIVPIENRIVLLKMAYWFFSAYIKEDKDRVLMYKADAIEGLGGMVTSYELGDEPNTLMDDDLMSPQFIRPPAGYPNFRNLV